jgi:hypothetical protein
MKHRVVSVGDRRNAIRAHNIVSEALAEAGVKLTPEQRAVLFATMHRLAAEEGLTLTRQVSA